MGSHKNKRQKTAKRSIALDRREHLKQSDKGSYYSDLLENEVRDSSETFEAETGILIEEEVDSVVTASERKLLVFPSVDFEEERDVLEGSNVQEEQEVQEEGNRIIDISVLSDVISIAANCSTCNFSGLSLKEKASARKGWASTMYLHCNNCDKTTLFSTSKRLGEGRNQPATINR